MPVSKSNIAKARSGKVTSLQLRPSKHRTQAVYGSTDENLIPGKSDRRKVVPKVLSRDDYSKYRKSIDSKTPEMTSFDKVVRKVASYILVPAALVTIPESVVEQGINKY